MLRHIFIDLISDKHSISKAKSIKNDGNWSTSIFTEVLFLFNEITEDELSLIDKLRRKRNDLFHLKPLERSKIEKTHAGECIILSLKFFYRILGLSSKDESRIIGFPSVRKKIYHTLHGGY